MFERAYQRLLYYGSILFTLSVFAVYFASIQAEYVASPSFLRQKAIHAMIAVLVLQSLSFYYTNAFNHVLEEIKVYSDKVGKQAKDKEVFFACMSHEIRNPIQSLIGSIELLLPSMPANQETAKLVDICRCGSDVVLNLVSNIIDISKIHSNKMELSMSSSNVREIIQKVLRLNKERADCKGIYLRFLDSPELPPVLEMDSRKLGQVVLNLVANAIKFTSKGGVTIQLSWKLTEKERTRANIELEPPHHKVYKKYSLEFTSRDSPKMMGRTTGDSSNRLMTGGPGEIGQVSIKVIDTGIGIEPRNMARLFQAFGQADSSISR